MKGGSLLPKALGLAGAVIAFHFAVWGWVAHSRAVALTTILNRWDAELYSRIVSEEYVSGLRAFLPLYPGLIKGLWLLLGQSPAVLGTAFSSFCLVAMVLWAASTSESGSCLRPETLWGWFFFLASPASYALHSHHTEGLFVLLSFGAFTAAWAKRLWPTVLLASLCVWTRNQGVLVAGTAALLLASRSTGAKQRGDFIRVALGTGLSFAGLLLFNEVTLGDALAHVHAQQNWAHADSLMSIVRTLWMGNPWNQPSVTLAQRYVFVAFLLFASWGIMRVNRPLGIYSFASAGLMLLQADFGNAFRFGAVLFPALFWFGDWVSQKPRWARWLVALLAVVVNFKVTYAYAVGRWAY